MHCGVETLTSEPRPIAAICGPRHVPVLRMLITVLLSVRLGRRVGDVKLVLLHRKVGVVNVAEPHPAVPGSRTKSLHDKILLHAVHGEHVGSAIALPRVCRDALDVRVVPAFSLGAEAVAVVPVLVVVAVLKAVVRPACERRRVSEEGKCKG